jgi:hypothetical protein
MRGWRTRTAVRETADRASLGCRTAAARHPRSLIRNGARSRRRTTRSTQRSVKDGPAGSRRWHTFKLGGGEHGIFPSGAATSRAALRRLDCRKTHSILMRPHRSTDPVVGFLIGTVCLADGPRSRRTAPDITAIPFSARRRRHPKWEPSRNAASGACSGASGMGGRAALQWAGRRIRNFTAKSSDCGYRLDWIH